MSRSHVFDLNLAGNMKSFEAPRGDRVVGPFHLSIAVPDLNDAKAFYGNVLGCALGRDTGHWLDVLFFGHQLTIHQASETKPAVAIDHFGMVLEKSHWLEILADCQTHGIEFSLLPRKVKEGAAGESGKFVICDPAGNRLEFKY